MRLLHRASWGLVLALSLIGCGEAVAPADLDLELALANAAVTPELVLPRNAAWQPRWQELRNHRSRVEGDQRRWACYSSGNFERTLVWYERQLEAEAERTSKAFSEWLDGVEPSAEATGVELPSRPIVARLKRAEFAESAERAGVLVISPYTQARTGVLNGGALICLFWSGQTP